MRGQRAGRAAVRTTRSRLSALITSGEPTANATGSDARARPRFRTCAGRRPGRTREPAATSIARRTRHGAHRPRPGANAGSSGPHRARSSAIPVGSFGCWTIVSALGGKAGRPGRSRSVVNCSDRGTSTGLIPSAARCWPLRAIRRREEHEFSASPNARSTRHRAGHRCLRRPQSSPGESTRSRPGARPARPRAIAPGGELEFAGECLVDAQAGRQRVRQEVQSMNRRTRTTQGTT